MGEQAKVKWKKSISKLPKSTEEGLPFSQRFSDSSVYAESLVSDLRNPSLFYAYSNKHVVCVYTLVTRSIRGQSVTNGATPV